MNRLIENIGAVSVELTTDDLLEIERASSNIKVEGARYPEHLEKLRENNNRQRQMTD
jgi:hypothetical protein